MVLTECLQDPSRLRALDAEGISSLGEAIRDEAERLARSDPTCLDGLYEGLRRAVGQAPGLRPWTLWAEGLAEHLRGRTATAEPLLRRASLTFRRRGDEHHAARVDLTLMDALACQGHHRAAARRGRRAFDTFAAAGDRPRTVSALLNLGGLADARDRVRDAIQLWQRARRLLPGDDRVRQGLVEASLAAGVQALGRFHEAAELYAHAVELFESEKATASALHPRLGLAEVRGLLGEVGEALTELQRCQAAAQGMEDDNLLTEARLLLARLEVDLGHPERAASLARTTLDDSQRRGRPDDVARCAAVLAIAVAQGAEGDGEEEATRAERDLTAAGLGVAAAALRVELARHGRDRRYDQLQRDVTSLHRAGLTVHADLGRLECARLLAASGRRGQADRLCAEVLGRRHASLWPRIEAHRLRAELAFEAEPSTAVRHLWRVVRLAESVRGRLASEGDRAAFSARTASAYEDLVELLLRRGDARSRRQAFTLVARLKSRTLVEALDRRRDRQWQDSPDLVRRWNSMRQELAAMLAALEGRHGEHARYSSAVVAGRIREVSRHLEDVELELARSPLGLGLVLGRVAMPRLRPLLRPGEVFLELFLSGPDLILFHLTTAGLGVSRLPDHREWIEEQVESIRFQLSKAAYGRRHLEAPGPFLVGQARDRLAALGERLLAPLERFPRPGCLYVAPHGPLHHLPVAALELGGEPVLAHCPVAVVPGSGILAHLLQRPQRRPRRLAIAGAAPAELPEIDREVREIARRFPSARVAREAGVDLVRSMLGEFDAVHVASHGAFQPLFPAGSGIRLADGWLTALDLLRCTVTARFVCLAACASGQLAVTPGEELMGVVRALLAGGAQTAVVAPGVLDDAVARRAALLLYQDLLASGPGQALRRALLGLREEHPHPALWAGLQLYGNPRPWEDEP